MGWSFWQDSGTQTDPPDPESAEKQWRCHVCNSSTDWWMILTAPRREGRLKDRIKTLMSSGSATWSCHRLNRASVWALLPVMKVEMKLMERRKSSNNKQRARVSSKGENTGARKTILTRRSREASWSWRQTWGPVAHTPRPWWTRNGTKSCARSVGWSSFWSTGKENSTSGRTWQPEGWRGWKQRAPSLKTWSAKPASKEPSRTAPKSWSWSSTIGSSTRVLALVRLPLVKSSSSTPAPCKARRYSWSVLTHGRKSSATMLVLREGIEPERRGARERGRRKRTERGQAEQRSKWDEQRRWRRNWQPNRSAKSSRYAAILQDYRMRRWLQPVHTSSTTALRAVHLLWACARL